MILKLIPIEFFVFGNGIFLKLFIVSQILIFSIFICICVFLIFIAVANAILEIIDTYKFENGQENYRGE